MSDGIKVQRSKRKRARGRVTSARMAKTLVVSVDRLVKHPRVEKYVRRQTVLVVHDENREAGEGDEVVVEETRPLSKTKRWRLVQILKKSTVPAGGIVPAALTVEGDSQARRAAKKLQETDAPEAGPSREGQT